MKLFSCYCLSKTFPGRFHGALLNLFKTEYKFLRYYIFAIKQLRMQNLNVSLNFKYILVSLDKEFFWTYSKF